MDSVFDRTPPFSLEAERSVLSAMIFDVDAIVTGVEILNELSFYREAHRRLYRAIVAVWESGAAVDVVTISERL